MTALRWMRRAAKGWHRDDRAASGQPRQAAYARSAKVSRYMRRWLVERFSSWIPWQGRILIRWEYHVHNFLELVELACLVILFKRF